MIKTKLEVIEETVKFYTEDVSRRSIASESEKCMYHASNGNMCAVGRCLKDAKKLESQLDNFSFTSISSLYNTNQITIDDFNPEYQINDIAFWQDLQSFHDKGKFWNSQGLTIDGENYVTRLKEQYG